MSRVKDETGNRYGKLIVLERDGSDQRGLATWKCKCDCGNIITVRGADLRNGHTQSCGCYKIEKIKETKIKDISNQRFGRLIALYPTEKRSGQNVMWHCKCDCGNEKDISSNSLVRGETQSCGCLHKEILKSLNFKDLTNQKFGLLTVLYQNGSSPEDKVLWHCKCDCGNEKDIISGSLLSGKTLSCGCLKASHGELKISEILKDNNIDFIQEYTPQNHNLSFKPRFDFYLPNIQCLIEFDGKQHYNPNTNFFDKDLKTFVERQEHDKAKNKWALNNNIPLIRIPYTHYDNIKLEDLLPETSSFVVREEV